MIESVRMDMIVFVNCQAHFLDVAPAKAGVQSKECRALLVSLDPGLRRDDGCYQILIEGSS